VVGWVNVLAVAGLCGAGCRARDAGAPSAAEDLTTVTSALSADGGVTSANLPLQVSKNFCSTTVAQDYFKLTNGTGASIPLSQLGIKYWINDNSATTMAPQIFYGGCVTSSNGTCVHPITGVTANAVRFAPGCGPDANHQADWEITISTTDAFALGAGQSWSNLQTAVNLSTHAVFSPGTSTWFSGCGTGGAYATDPHFSAIYQGNLVAATGNSVPICRTPAVLTIQNFVDENYYATTDIASSFTLAQGEQIDCIPFAAQHSVKAWLARGVAMPQTIPAAPARPASMPAPNVAPNQAFGGQLDANGHPEQCGAGLVPVKRPSVAQIQAAGGVAAYLQSRPTQRLRGSQDPLEHDCWLNDAAGDGVGAIGTSRAVDWEHAAGIQNGNWAGNAAGIFGAHMVTSIYTPFVQTANVALPPVGPEHAVSQFWVQTGTCEDWYGVYNCATGSQCTGCTGASCPANCAVQSLEMTSFTDAARGTRLEIFFTADGYHHNNCYAGKGAADGTCLGCPMATVTVPGTTTQIQVATDCFVGLPSAPFMPDQPLMVNGGVGAAQYGIVPNEMEFSVWNGAGTSTPGWWISVGGQQIGWYPPQSFNWPDGSAGPMGSGPATYLQAGGEVYNAWPNGFHTDTAMASDNAAQSGYEFAAYQRNIGYYDASRSMIPVDASLTYEIEDPAEIDNGVPGLCGFKSGAWTDATGAQGGYSMATTLPAGGNGWGKYHYFGGGLLSKEIAPTLPALTVSIGAVGSEISGHGPDICFTGSHFTANGPIDIEYVGVPIPGVLSQVTSTFNPTADGNGNLVFQDDTFVNDGNDDCSNAQLTSTVAVDVIDIRTNRLATVQIEGRAFCNSPATPAHIGDVTGCGINN
jgi:hypothetical protein